MSNPNQLLESTVVELDGSQGEGGGQILRSALTLSLVTGKPFHVRNIRAGRKKPGVLRQHLTALQAATEVGSARVKGAALGSAELSFEPETTRSGTFHFSVGTAGSTTLVLQTVLPALVIADGPSTMTLEGGTHNPFAPPFDFLDRVLLPTLGRMGAQVTAKLERPGFYPAGGGRLTVEIHPTPKLARIDLLTRGEILSRRATACVSNLRKSIAEREVKAVGEGLSWKPEWLQVEQIRNATGPGNVLTVEIESEQVTELFTGFGRKEATAEQVAREVVREVREYLAAGVPVGSHLADQLLVPMAVAGGGSFRTVAPTSHTLTNIEIVRSFLDVDIKVEKEDRSVWRVDVNAGGSRES